MVLLIFVAFIVKGIVVDIPPDYGWKIEKSTETDYKAYNYKDEYKVQYSCKSIEGNK